MKKKEIRKLDNIVKQQVKERDNYTCQFPGCGKSGKGMHCHHIFTVRNRATRWYKLNLILLCPGHHTFRIDSAHKAPADFIEFIKERLGEKEYDALRLLAHTVVRNQTYESVVEELA